MTESIIITAMVCGTLLAMLGTIVVGVNIEEFTRAVRATIDWWRKRGE